MLIFFFIVLIENDDILHILDIPDTDHLIILTKSTSKI